MREKPMQQANLSRPKDPLPLKQWSQVPQHFCSFLVTRLEEFSCLIKVVHVESRQVGHYQEVSLPCLSACGGPPQKVE